MRSTRKNLPLEQRAAGALAAAGIEDRARLVVGVSGGPDSTALLSILSSLSRQLHFLLHACIVDHGIRDRREIDGDIEFVRELSRSLGAEFLLLKAGEGECAGRARREGRSLEEAAREVRLGLLQEAASKLGAQAVILGHTRDDEVETILMRIIQGSGPAGLSGISVRRGVFVRPLLSVMRSEILEYLESRKLGYRIDSTNSEMGFLRNRIRAELIPALQNTYPGFRSGLLSLSRKLSLFNGYLMREAAARLPWSESKNGFRIKSEEFFTAPAALRAQSLLALFDRLPRQGSRRRLPFRFLAPALGPLPAGDRTILRGHGVRLRQEGPWLSWEQDIVREGEKSYFIAAEPDGSYLISRVVRVDFTRGSRGEAEAGEVRIRASAIVPPLVIRSKRKGDELLLTYGRKSIKELFQEWKVSDDAREEIPLLADRSGVLAVLGSALGHGTRVRNGAQGGEGDDSVCIRVRRVREPRDDGRNA